GGWCSGISQTPASDASPEVSYPRVRDCENPAKTGLGNRLVARRAAVRLPFLVVERHAQRGAQVLSSPADRAQRAGEQVLDLGEPRVDVRVALAAPLLGLLAGLLHDPLGLGVGVLHHFGLGHQAGLLRLALVDRLLVGGAT